MMKGMVLLLFLASVSSHSISLTRAPHKIHSHVNEVAPWINKYRSVDGQATGNSFPLNGGVLTMGSYFVNMSVGTPGEYFNFLIDTGSSNLIIPSVNCPSCGANQVYDPRRSSSSSVMSCSEAPCTICSPPNYFGNTSKCVFGQPVCQSNQCGFGVTYGGGSSSVGAIGYFDRVCLGDICIQKENIEVVTRNDPPSQGPGSGDGLIGFAYQMNACNPSCTSVFFDDVVKQQRIPNLFSICITPSNGGVLDLGIVDPAKYTGVMQWTPIVSERWYNLQVLDVLIGGTSIGAPVYSYSITNDVIGSFVDSGTSVILFAPLVYQYVQNLLTTKFANLVGFGTFQNFFSGDCIEASIIDPAAYPAITFTIAGQNGQSFNLDVPAQSWLMKTPKNCYTLGFASVSGIGIVMGDLFMENFYIVHDKGNSRLGFAPLRPGSCQ